MIDVTPTTWVLEYMDKWGVQNEVVLDVLKTGELGPIYRPVVWQPAYDIYTGQPVGTPSNHVERLSLTARIDKAWVRWLPGDVWVLHCCDITGVEILYQVVITHMIHRISQGFHEVDLDMTVIEDIDEETEFMREDILGPIQGHPPPLDPVPLLEGLARLLAL